MQLLTWILFFLFACTGVLGLYGWWSSKTKQAKRTDSWKAASGITQVGGVKAKTAFRSMRWSVAVLTHDATVKRSARKGECWVCHRPLTEPESIRNGYGPVCADTAKARARALTKGSSNWRGMSRVDAEASRRRGAREEQRRAKESTVILGQQSVRRGTSGAARRKPPSSHRKKVARGQRNRQPQTGKK